MKSIFTVTERRAFKKAAQKWKGNIKSAVRIAFSSGARAAVPVIAAVTFACCGSPYMKHGRWTIAYDTESRGIIIEYDSTRICSSLYASCIVNGTKVSSTDYPAVRFSEKAVADSFGRGMALVITYAQHGMPTLVQSFFAYDGKEYLLTDFAVSVAGDSVSSNFMAPVNIGKPEFPDCSDENRALFIPFDNDSWIRYRSHRLDFDGLASYEATAVFNSETRRGIVLGSVEHDRWKSAVRMTGARQGRLDSLICYGGVADRLTRDRKPHGRVAGKTVKSPKVFIGVFDDWRDGLERYAEANAAAAPQKTWDGAVPFGWNSWGALQFNLTFDKAMEVSDWIAENLQGNSFVNSDSAVCIGLDSGWSVFTEDQLKAFVQKCRDNGQTAGIYWTPFADWGKNPGAKVRYAEEYRYSDAYLYADGKPQELDGAYAIDPTHPAVELRMKKTSELFRRCGFKYVKMDFMTHGALEADRWHRPEMQTGVQAYNYGMTLLNRYFGDMYINLSISPVFPAHHAQSRRIACDAWNRIKDTEYTLNALSYGWWTGKAYRYSDADHVVLRDATEGENRARVTSAVITGLYIAGDDFSREGDAAAKERAAKYLANGRINSIATGVSFRPVEGSGKDSENQFMRSDEKGTYYVCFNYTDSDTVIKVPLKRIGVDGNSSSAAAELWTGRTVSPGDSLTVPAKDVIVLFIPHGD